MIPVIVNNRDLMPGKIIADLLAMDGVEVVHLIDNASTYGPLLEWMDRNTDSRIRIHRWGNCGPRAACRLVNQLRDELTARGITHYATTDSDLDLSQVSKGALIRFVGLLNCNSNMVKAGCALRIDDLPDTPQGRLAKVSEAKHRHHSWPIHSGIVYRADIDTTLAAYRLNPPWDGAYGPSARVESWYSGEQYQARHLPWYHTAENRPADYRWYLDHADPQGTFYTAMEKAKCNQ